MFSCNQLSRFRTGNRIILIKYLNTLKTVCMNDEAMRLYISVCAALAYMLLENVEED